MRRICNYFGNQKGISIIEMIWVMALIGLVIAGIGPLFRDFMVGEPPGEGFAGTVIENQTRGVNETSHSNIELVDGCDGTTSNCTNVID